jgi:large subunit ribosomal protein L25
MKTISIDAELRERTGKGGARTDRRDGRLPCVLYGQGKSAHLSVDRKTFQRALHDAQDDTIIFDLNVPGEGEPLKSIAREVQHHPVSRVPIHVDFQHIDMTKAIQVNVAVHLQGEPEGVRNFGGILEHVARELEVLCLPVSIPSAIDVDVTHLLVGDSVHVSDVHAEGYEIQEEPSKVIAQVAAPTVEKVSTAEEEEAEAEGVPAETEDAKEEAPAEAKGDGE